jgi:hypothetical protein
MLTEGGGQKVRRTEEGDEEGIQTVGIVVKGITLCWKDAWIAHVFVRKHHRELKSMLKSVHWKHKPRTDGSRGARFANTLM